jgi:hypothetical protein
MTGPATRYDALVTSLRAEFPRFQIMRKDRSRLHKAIHHALRAVTLGRMTSYLGAFQTTIGRTVYVTPDWDDWEPDRRYVTLRHEAVHLRQFRSFGLAAGSRMVSRVLREGRLCREHSRRGRGVGAGVSAPRRVPPPRDRAIYRSVVWLDVAIPWRPGALVR